MVDFGKTEQGLVEVWDAHTAAEFKQKSADAAIATMTLVESLTNTKALLTRLEAGVHVARNEQREVIRLLYVATRHQVKALAACLELEGLE